MASSENLSQASPHQRSRLRINAASSNVIHALEKKAQKFGIYKTSYPDGTPLNPAISDKTDLETLSK